MSLRKIGLTDCLHSPFAGMLGVDLGDRDTAAPNHLAGFRAVQCVAETHRKEGNIK
jgi:hypothetical protein